MVDAERALLGEMGDDRFVDLAARLEVRSERFLERQPHRRAGEARGGEPVDGRLEQRWRGRKEDGDAARRVADRLGQPGESGPVGDVERNVANPLEEAPGGLRIVE